MPTPSVTTPSLHLPTLSGHWRYAGLLLGVVIAAAGIAATLQGRLGVGPLDVLNDGLSKQAGITFGTASVIASTTAVLLGWRLGAKLAGGSLFAMLALGPSVDMWLLAVPQPPGLTLRLAFFLVGMLLLAFGLSLLIAADLGPGPIEVLMLGLTGRGVPLRWVRTGIEAALAVVGGLLGGQLGLGTLVIVLVIGHLIAAFVPAGIK